jgi:hypothetical protein
VLGPGLWKIGGLFSGWLPMCRINRSTTGSRRPCRDELRLMMINVFSTPSEYPARHDGPAASCAVDGRLRGPAPVGLLLACVLFILSCRCRHAHLCSASVEPIVGGARLWCEARQIKSLPHHVRMVISDTMHSWLRIEMTGLGWFAIATHRCRRRPTPSKSWQHCTALLCQ